MARSRLYPPSVDPGIPSLGSCPPGWSTVAFDEALSVVQRPAQLRDGEAYQLVVAKRSRGGIAPRTSLNGEDILTKTQFFIDQNDFLISRRQIIHGACGVVPPALAGAVVSNEYATLRVRPEILGLRFLSYLCHTSYFQRTCFHASVGVDVEKMIFKLDDWLRYQVHLPPVSEQRKIAAILSSVDDAIEKTQAVIDQLQVVKKGLMQELLTRGLPGRHTRFKHTEIGEVPEEWGITSLGAIAEVAYGLTVNKQRRSSDTRRSYLTVANLKDWGWDLNTVKEIGVLPGDEERYGLRDGDLLLVEGNGNPNLLGMTAIWTGQPGMLHQNHLIRARPTERGLSRWLWWFINSPAGHEQILAQAKTSSGLHTINSKVVSDLLVPLPHADERRLIVDALDTCLRREKIEADKRSGLLQVKAALMSVLLTGEVRVPLDESEAA